MYVCVGFCVVCAVCVEWYVWVCVVGEGGVCVPVVCCAFVLKWLCVLCLGVVVLWC